MLQIFWGSKPAPVTGVFMLSVIIWLPFGIFKNPFLGDNMLTAISVARDCGMVQTYERVIIVDALPPRDFQPASITWRYTENPRDVVDQVRFKQPNSWRDRCKVHVVTG